MGKVIPISSRSGKGEQKRGTKKGNKARKKGPVTLGYAVEAFLTDKKLSAASKRTYRAAFSPFLEELSADAKLGDLEVDDLRPIFEERWGESAAATWNNRVAAWASLFSYAVKQRWVKLNPVEMIERYRVPRDDTKAISFAELEHLWSGPVHLREKTLWRFLYSTAARVEEVLSLDIEDLDLGRKRANIIGKGDHKEVIVWDATTARLLRRYLEARTEGPVFLTYNQPNVEPADLDRAPDGRARLSYQRAWAIFSEASGREWTLHQLRHSALTHLGEEGVSEALLMAKSRHRDPRTLSRYVKPGVEAVAKLTAEHDRARRKG